MSDRTCCSQWTAFLAIRDLNELSPSERHSFQAHLAQCPECRVAREKYQRMGLRLHALPSVEPLTDSSLKLIRLKVKAHRETSQPITSPLSSVKTEIVSKKHGDTIRESPRGAPYSIFERIATYSTVVIIISIAILLFGVHHGRMPHSTRVGTGMPKQGVISEYVIPTHNAHADSITLGPDGNLWFTEDAVGKIGRITPQGQVTEFSLPTPESNPSIIVLGSDGNLWVLENGSTKIARVTPQGHITEFPVSPGSNLVGLAVGKDGNLWFTEFQTNKIGRMNISGQITGEFPIPTPDSGAAWITQGPDGNLWFDEQRGNQVGRITPSGHITEFPYPTSSVSGTQNNHNLAAGPDGNVWFTDFWHSRIGRITPSGHITEFPLPTHNGVPSGIAAGPDGNLWFTECVLDSSQNLCVSNSKIGRITPQGVITEYSLPIATNGPAAITAGPDGNIWFTEDPGNKIGKITTGF